MADSPQPAPDRRIRTPLLAWYRGARRDLPWRGTRDPYRIWVSEIMLQQTRVAAALPYYQRFVNRFPDAAALARASEAEVLACWSGLGYYSRARNLLKAARLIQQDGGFPRDYQSIRRLPGVGDYTAAAIASIAFGLPHAVLDGNVMRVLARVLNETGDIGAAATRKRLRQAADCLLDRRAPGSFNQALMELGATVCLPRDPQCRLCPIAQRCQARREGTQRELPIQSRRMSFVRIHKTLLLIQQGKRILLWKRDQGSARMAGFWELPEAGQLPEAVPGDTLGQLRHTITNHHYEVTVLEAEIARIPPGFRWVSSRCLDRIPLSTLARKALARRGVKIPKIPVRK